MSHQSKQSPSSLSETLEKNLLAYAAAAGAAGVAVLACTVPAGASVVAKKVNIPIPINGGVIQFDMNGDGQNDFGLSAFASPPCSTSAALRGEHQRPPLGCPFNDRVSVIPSQPTNEVWQAGTSYGAACAENVAGGVKIGAARPFGAGKLLMAAHSGTSEGHYFCPWQGSPAPRPFLGVKFTDTSGAVHFGWVRVTVNFDNQATITNWAYETVPNRPILAGARSEKQEQGGGADAASLGRLAEGASGVSAWRRDTR